MNSDTEQSDDQVPLSAKLNLETARAPWSELQTFFAHGSVIHVHESLDLLLVGEQLAADNTDAFKEWTSANLVGPVSDDQARDWYEASAEVWTLVIKPWVLVQSVNA